MTAMQFSSNVFQPELRAQAIREVKSSGMRVDVDFASDCTPFFQMTTCALPNAVSIATFSGSGGIVTRNAAQAVANDSALALCVKEQGNVRLKCARNEAVYSPGEGYIWMADRSLVCEVDGDYSAFMLTIPSVAIESAGVDLDRILALELPPHSPEMQLLKGYAITLLSEFTHLKTETAEHASSHLLDLALLALASQQEKSQFDTRGSIRAARLDRIKTNIEANLSRTELSAEWVAAREGISPRYLRDLFALEQTNFTDFVMLKRLQRTYRLLIDPRQPHRLITDIAYDSGFGDLSYFNRCFKRHYKATPSDIRNTLNPSLQASGTIDMVPQNSDRSAAVPRPEIS